MSHSDLLHTIEEMDRFVARSSDPASSEYSNLVHSVKYFVGMHRDWDAYLYAFILLHDVLDQAKKGKAFFKYLSKDEESELSKKFRENSGKLATTLDKIYQDWGGPDRLKLEKEQMTGGSFLGGLSHIPEKKAAFKLFKTR